MTPFFSIGVTTYDRIEMLIETLRSILNQTFSDYEVVVSNDNPARTITGESLGINDGRVRFVNQAKNLGERSNMNFLLKESKGRYFTWFADDDLYRSDFLKRVHEAIIKFDFPACVFTSYIMGGTYHGFDSTASNGEQLFTGQQFLGQYLARVLKIQGCYGVFDTGYLRQVGGIGQLGSGFSSYYGDLPGNVFFPYADNLLIIRSGLLEKVIFIDSPLIFYRTHEGSVSLINTDLDAYSSAQKDLCNEFVNIFYKKKTLDNFQRDLYLLLKWCIGDFVAVALRSRVIKYKQLAAYIIFLRNYARFLGCGILYWKIVGFLIKAMAALALGIGKARFKLLLRK